MTRHLTFICTLCTLAITALTSTLSLAQPSLDDFLEEATLRDSKLSPNSRYLAQVWNVDDRRIVTIQDLEAPGKTITGKLADKVILARSASWANSERKPSLLVRQK